MNDKNIIFYNNIGLDPFKELAEKGGFSTFKDLELISSFIPKNATILELGAGYGRCLDYFIQNHHAGKLIAVERSAHLYEYLTKKYNSTIELLNKDIKELVLQEKVDIALWMWSGIIDFAPAEQIESCRKIFNLLNKGGKLFIDVPMIGVQTIALHKDKQNLVLTTPYGEIEAYIPDEQDMENIRLKTGYERIEIINYSTATDKKRTIYILEK